MLNRIAGTSQKSNCKNGALGNKNPTGISIKYNTNDNAVMIPIKVTILVFFIFFPPLIEKPETPGFIKKEITFFHPDFTVATGI